MSNGFLSPSYSNLIFGTFQRERLAQPVALVKGDPRACRGCPGREAHRAPPAPRETRYVGGQDVKGEIKGVIFWS